MYSMSQARPQRPNAAAVAGVPTHVPSTTRLSSAPTCDKCTRDVAELATYLAPTAAALSPPERSAADRTEDTVIDRQLPHATRNGAVTAPHVKRLLPGPNEDGRALGRIIVAVITRDRFTFSAYLQT